jgi:hypothetical protein
MSTIQEYVGTHKDSPDWTPERQANAVGLLAAENALQKRMESDGVIFHTNPKTGCTISGSRFGGFRPQNCPIGAPHSAHKEGFSIDKYDPYNEIDVWLLDHEDVLEEFGIYIEHPSTTPNWSHWSLRAPPSGHHIFYP